jgi:hypothetical protein
VTAYKPGDRVVCPDPDGGSFVGAVAHVDTSGGLTVTYSPAQVVRASPDEVRPAMPRDRHDLIHGQWWWLNNKPVWITPGVRLAWTHSPGWPHGNAVTPDGDWRGPVARPPEVRS